MKYIGCAITPAAFAVSAVFICSVPLLGQQYSIRDLGPIHISPAGHRTGAYGVNNLGQVVGGAPIGGACRAVLWQPGSSLPLELGTLGGDSYALGINDGGSIVGRYGSPFSSGNTNAFIWTSSNAMRQLFPLAGNLFSTAGSINANGQAAGVSQNFSGDPSSHAVIWSGTAAIDIGTLPGVSYSAAPYPQSGINSYGQVVGGSGTGGASLRAFLWTPAVANGTTGGMVQLGTLGGTQSNATVINAGGIVAGSSQTVSGVWHPFVWVPATLNGSTGAMSDLGVLGGDSASAQGINDAGQIVGSSQLPGNVASHAFVYSAGTMRDLNNLIPAASGWDLLEAFGINNQGQIVGFGSFGGQLHSYLLTPSALLSVSKSHLGAFAQGQSGATYTVQVSNAVSAAPTSGPVTVTETVPTGMTLVAMSGGSTWNCTVLPACTTSVVLGSGASYPPITVTVNVAGNAPALVINRVSVSGGGSDTATASDPTNVAISYLVGDVWPSTSDTAPNFGDAILDIRDLVQELFAVNNVPGFRPPPCSDRYDALDVFPPPSGDGLLDIRDLVLELFRVNNLDPTRPLRPSRGGVCSGPTTGSSTNRMETTGNRRSALRPRLQLQGLLVLDEPERSADAGERVAVYLEAKHDLMRVAVTFALGDQRSSLRFVPTVDTPPTLGPYSQLGVVAVAWLKGMSVRAGERLLLGYVVGPAGTLANLKAFGISASSLDDDGQVHLGVKTRTGLDR